MVQTVITPFSHKIGSPLTKNEITVLQINLGKRCNQACIHCHVEAGPNRTEEMSSAVCDQLIELIHRFDSIQTVDITGGAPEMNYGFKPLVEASCAAGKQVIVRSNLTIFFEPGFAELPAYFAEHKLQVVASLPCYLSNNVDKMRGNGVYDRSIQGIKLLNDLGYASDPELILNLVYNPSLPTSRNQFYLPPPQEKLEADYKIYLDEHSGIKFNQLLTLTNLPIGRTKLYLQRQQLHQPYLQFLEDNFNPETVPHLMCRNELSIDYLGNIYDCDFNQMEGIPAKTADGETLTVAKLLSAGSLDVITEVQTAAFCYGCTAGSGSSCGGALVD